MLNHRLFLDALLLAFRPARWSIFGFRYVPLVLLAAGIWAVVYGGYYHRIPVSETHKEEVTIVVPVQPPMPPPLPPGMAPFSSTDAFGQPDPSGLPEASGPPVAFSPPVKFIQAWKPVKSTSQELELVVNRAVTVAGMMRDEQGEIVRVGSAAEGPAFCPT